MIDIQKELDEISEDLSRLSALEETFKRFKEAGLQERLKEQNLLVKEEQIFKMARIRLGQVREGFENIRMAVEVDRAFVSKAALKDLPAKEILGKIYSIFVILENNLKKKLLTGKNSSGSAGRLRN